MDRRLFYNGKILTMNDAAPYAEYVLTEGEKILDVGSGQQAAQYLAGGLGLLIPTFIC